MHHNGILVALQQEHCSIVGLVKEQVNQNTNEPMYSEQVQRQKV